MKRRNYYKLCYYISTILALVFVVKVIIDYITYKTTLNSAPFYLWIVVDAIYFLLPAGVALVIGKIIRKLRE